jgi:putative ABC transport system permease protein
MHNMARWTYKLPLLLRSLLRKGKAEDELDDELRFHMENLIEEHVTQGMSPKDARFTALRELGGIEQHKEECRDARGIRWLDELRQDLGYGVRTLGRSPGFTISAVVTLAIAIGVNIAVFSVVNSVLLRPLPYERPDELVVPISSEFGEEYVDGYSPPYYRVLRQRNTVCQDMGLFDIEPGDLTGGSGPENLKVAFMTASVFDVLRVQAAKGRIFASVDDKPGSANLVLLSDRLWKRRFMSDPGIIGKVLHLNDQAYTVVGIMPDGFDFPSSDTEMWSPFNVANAGIFNIPTARQAGLHVIARLRPGSSLKQATSDFKTIRASFGYSNDFRIVRWNDYLVRKMRTALLLLLGAVGFVLLIACSNVASLLLVRGESRRKELAIRSALGASTSRLIRHSLTESGLLSLTGRVLGLLLANWMLNVVVTLAPTGIAAPDNVRLDGNVLVFALAAILTSMLAAGLLPAFKGCKADTSVMMKGEALSTPTPRLGARHALIISELALALILLAGAGLMIRTMLNLMRIDLGFDARNVLTVQLDSSIRKGPQDNAGRLAYYDRRTAVIQNLVERLAALPGVEAAAATTNLPLNEGGFARVTKEGNKNSVSSLWADEYAVTPDYFRVLGITLLKGRFFDNTDGKNSPLVAVVDKAMADRFWPSMDPLGKQVRYGAGPWHTVVGVVSTVRSYGLKSGRMGMFADAGQIFFPATQPAAAVLVGPTLAIRTRVDPLSLVEAVRQEVWKFDKDQPVSDVATLESLVSDFTAGPRFYMALLTAFAMIALVLAAVGSYGVTSYWVAQRTHEIGVRLALGAQRGDVLRMVVRQGMVLTIVGLIIGLAGSLALTRLLSGMIYGLTATDTTTYVSTCAFLGLSSLGACYIPALRATRIDPLAALRQE